MKDVTKDTTPHTDSDCDTINTEDSFSDIDDDSTSSMDEFIEKDVEYVTRGDLKLPSSQPMAQSITDATNAKTKTEIEKMTSTEYNTYIQTRKTDRENTVKSLISKYEGMKTIKE